MDGCRPTPATGLSPDRTLAVLLDHFGCPHQNRVRNFDTKRFSGFSVDQQLEICGLLDGEIGRLGTLQDLIHVNGSTDVAALNAVRIPCLASDRGAARAAEFGR